MTYSSPLPPPRVVEEYARLIPDGGDRLMRMAEKQQDHRHHLERTVIEKDANRSTLALFVEAVIVLVALVCGTVLILNDETGVGVATAFVPLLIALGTHIYGRHKKERDMGNLRRSTQVKPPENQLK